MIKKPSNLMTSHSTFIDKPMVEKALVKAVMVVSTLPYLVYLCVHVCVCVCVCVFIVMSLHGPR